MASCRSFLYLVVFGLIGLNLLVKGELGVGDLDSAVNDLVTAPESTLEALSDDVTNVLKDPLNVPSLIKAATNFLKCMLRCIQEGLGLDISSVGMAVAMLDLKIVPQLISDIPSLDDLTGIVGCLTSGCELNTDSSNDEEEEESNSCPAPEEEEDDDCDCGCDEDCDEEEECDEDCECEDDCEDCEDCDDSCADDDDSKDEECSECVEKKEDKCDECGDQQSQQGSSSGGGSPSSPSSGGSPSSPSSGGSPSNPSSGGSPSSSGGSPGSPSSGGSPGSPSSGGSSGTAPGSTAPRNVAQSRYRYPGGLYPQYYRTPSMYPGLYPGAGYQHPAGSAASAGGGAQSTATAGHSAEPYDLINRLRARGMVKD